MSFQQLVQQSFAPHRIKSLFTLRFITNAGDFKDFEKLLNGKIQKRRRIRLSFHYGADYTHESSILYDVFMTSSVIPR